MRKKLNMHRARIPCVRYLLTFLCILFFSTTHPEGTFRQETVHSGESIMSYVINDTVVGQVTIKKTPIFNFYILHTLYVLPEHRNCGIGRNLLEYTCRHVMAQGASRIYIQPGPFEFDKNGYLVKPTEQYEERVQKLITLYEQCGFTQASRPLVYCAYLLYTCMGINEDSAHLMVQCSVD